MKITNTIAVCALMFAGAVAAQDTAGEQLDKLASQTMLLRVQAESAKLQQEIAQTEGRTSIVPPAHVSGEPAAPQILGTFSQAGAVYATVQSVSGRVQLVRVGNQVPGEPWTLATDTRGGLRLIPARGVAHGR